MATADKLATVKSFARRNKRALVVGTLVTTTVVATIVIIRKRKNRGF